MNSWPRHEPLVDSLHANIDHSVRHFHTFRHPPPMDIMDVYIWEGVKPSLGGGGWGACSSGSFLSLLALLLSLSWVACFSFPPPGPSPWGSRGPSTTLDCQIRLGTGSDAAVAFEKGDSPVCMCVCVNVLYLVPFPLSDGVGKHGSKPPLGPTQLPFCILLPVRHPMLFPDSTFYVCTPSLSPRPPLVS